jgi:hypothetical protein
MQGVDASVAEGELADAGVLAAEPPSVYPILPVEELGMLGYKIVVCPIETLLVAGAAVRRLIQALLTRGRVDLPPEELMTFAEVKQVLGLDEVLGLRQRVGGANEG